MPGTTVAITKSAKEVLDRRDIARIARDTCREAEKLKEWAPGRCFYRHGLVDGHALAVGLEWRTDEGYYVVIGLAHEITPEE